MTTTIVKIQVSVVSHDFAGAREPQNQRRLASLPNITVTPTSVKGMSWTHGHLKRKTQISSQRLYLRNDIIFRPQYSDYEEHQRCVAARSKGAEIERGSTHVYTSGIE